MSLPLRDTSRHTYGEYLNWTENQREELIDGIAYVKEPPAPARIHQSFVREMLGQLHAALKDRSWCIQVAPFDVRLPKSNEADEDVDTVVQPDLLIVRDRDKLDDRGMRGAPDWLVEVLSPRTTVHDRAVKLPVYERAGVGEVWLIQPTDLTLTMYVLDGGRYGQPRVRELKGQTSLATMPELQVDWDQLLPLVV